jgi:protein phosphatase
MSDETLFSGYSFDCYAITDIGKKSRCNQDEVIEDYETGFFAVSDGMGGFSSGGAAAKLTKLEIPLRIRKSADETKLLAGRLNHTSETDNASKCTTVEPVGTDVIAEKAAQLLDEVTAEFSDFIYKTYNEEFFDYGATLSGVWLIGEKAVFVNIGDSRSYIFNNEHSELRQITHDHSVAAFLVENDVLTVDEAYDHPSKSQLRKFLGMKPHAKPETFIEPLKLHDIIFICSDGLYGMLRDDEIQAILCDVEQTGKSIEGTAKRLIDAANEAGGKDNISVVLVKINKTAERTKGAQ